MSKFMGNAPPGHTASYRVAERLARRLELMFERAVTAESQGLLTVIYTVDELLSSENVAALDDFERLQAERRRCGNP